MPERIRQRGGGARGPPPREAEVPPHACLFGVDVVRSMGSSVRILPACAQKKRWCAGIRQAWSKVGRRRSASERASCSSSRAEGWRLRAKRGMRTTQAEQPCIDQKLTPIFPLLFLNRQVRRTCLCARQGCRSSSSNRRRLLVDREGSNRGARIISSTPDPCSPGRAACLAFSWPCRCCSRPSSSSSWRGSQQPTHARPRAPTLPTPFGRRAAAGAAAAATSARAGPCPRCTPPGPRGESSRQRRTTHS